MVKKKDKAETTFQKMQKIVRDVVSVPKAEIERRDAEWRKRRKGDLDESSH